MKLIDKTLILPDFHLRHILAQKIIDHEKANQIVFLGDFFDEYNDNPILNQQTALWIKNRQATHSEDIWLFGNHDISYAYVNRYTTCSGYSSKKAEAIKVVLTQENWDRFKFCVWVGPYLCTHAGLHPSHISHIAIENLPEYLDKEEQIALAAIRDYDPHWFYAAGYARGGSKAFGGILWLDFNSEFTATPGLNQIFGHTDVWGYISPNIKKNYGELITKDSKNYCLDTHSMYYGVWNGDELAIKYVPDSVPNWKTPPVTVVYTS